MDTSELYIKASNLAKYYLTNIRRLEEDPHKDHAFITIKRADTRAYYIDNKILINFI